MLLGESEPLKRNGILTLMMTHSTNYVVKFGPRRDTVNVIIEADTDLIKEVQGLRATFAPNPTQQTMLSNLGQGGWRP